MLLEKGLSVILMHYKPTYWTELRISILENEYCSLTSLLL